LGSNLICPGPGMLCAVARVLVAVSAPAAACSAGRAAIVSGIIDSMHWRGDGVDAYGSHVTLRHHSGVSLMSSECSDTWRPDGFKQLQLLGRTFSFTVDLSRVGCACNVALYLIKAPAKDVSGNFSAGSCPWSPYYCDANKVCGSFCPEVDIMEANTHAFQSTPHRCDAPNEAGHYGSCDGNGCWQNTKDMGPNFYGPGPSFRIDTTRPFHVVTTFHGSSQEGEAAMRAPSSFTGTKTVLQQEGREVVIDHPNCEGIFADLAKPMAEGMSLRITYWGDTPQNMSWLDMPPCGYKSCAAENAGIAVISNLRVSLPPKIRFPISFEESSEGGCPPGWSCMGGTKICDIHVEPWACRYPGVTGVDGSKYLSLGGDEATGIAVSPVFLLPANVDSLRFKRAGGADRGSGLYLRRRNDSRLLCASESPADTNSFFEASCPNLAGRAGEAVYIQIKDAQAGIWAKVLIDDLRLVSADGADLDAVQVSLAHAGESCLQQCGAAGYCNWCGSGNACCSGSPDDPSECSGVHVDIAGRHQCVVPASQVVMQRAGEDCWAHCSRAGFCTWCGSGNACCRSGDLGGSPPECNGVLHSTTRHFECVIPTYRDVSFPLSFEQTEEWSCPEGWHCTGDAGVCSARSTSSLCNHPGLQGVDGGKYLVVGNDMGTGTATSPVFVLPDRIDNIVFRRSGGADKGSGFYLYSKIDGRALCSTETGTDTNDFFEDRCTGLAGHGGEPVYIHLKDMQSSTWGKVLIDGIHLRDVFGMELAADHLWVQRLPNLLHRAADDFLYYHVEGGPAQPVPQTGTAPQPLWTFCGFSLATFLVGWHGKRCSFNRLREQSYSCIRATAENTLRA